jgi:uncharacterized membrane protein
VGAPSADDHRGNVGLFFGEDIFVAFGAIIFMHNFMQESAGIQTEHVLAKEQPDVISCRRHGAQTMAHLWRDVSITVFRTEPLHIALWGIPTAVAAFLIHSARLVRLDRQLARECPVVKRRGLARSPQERSATTSRISPASHIRYCC